MQDGWRCRVTVALPASPWISSTVPFAIWTDAPYPDLVMLQANQEHGIVALRPGAAQTAPTLPIGTRVRILPNHACATAAQHDRYLVVNGGREIEVVWPRLNGWTA